MSRNSISPEESGGSHQLSSRSRMPDRTLLKDSPPHPIAPPYSLDNPDHKSYLEMPHYYNEHHRLSEKEKDIVNRLVQLLKQKNDEDFEWNKAQVVMDYKPGYYGI